MSRDGGRASLRCAHFERLLPLALPLALACSAHLPGPAMPAPLAPAPAAEVASWVKATRLDKPMQARFRWTFIDDRGTAKGRGTVVIVPPDSLRVDFRGPLGSGAGAAFVVGDTKIWAEPEEDVRKLVPNYQLLWAMVGQALRPVTSDTVLALATASSRAWRYASEVDTVDYLWVGGTTRQLVADVRRGGDRIGHVFTTLDALGRVQSARLDVPSRPARLDLTFYAHETPDSLPASLWSRPDDAP